VYGVSEPTKKRGNVSIVLHFKETLEAHFKSLDTSTVAQKNISRKNYTGNMASV
jgi:hypothetical protein